MKEFRAPSGDRFRIVCPNCETTWTTLELPSECPTCSASVTVTARKPKPGKE